MWPTLERKEISISCQAERWFLQGSEQPTKSHPSHHPPQINKCIENTRNKTSNKIFPDAYETPPIFPYLVRVRALSICVGGWNGELAPRWEGGQRQGRDHRRIWERRGRLSKAKGRRGSGETALQVREGGAGGRTENMWVTPWGASRKKVKAEWGYLRSGMIQLDYRARRGEIWPPVADWIWGVLWVSWSSLWPLAGQHKGVLPVERCSSSSHQGTNVVRTAECHKWIFSKGAMCSPQLEKSELIGIANSANDSVPPLCDSCPQ